MGFLKRITRGGLKPELGGDFHQDIKAHLPKERIESFFDVGANVGQTVKKAKKSYPQATIFAFEPDRETFSILSGNVKGLSAKLFNIGLSSRAGQSYFSEDLASEMRHVTDSETDNEVTLDTLDKFCREHSVGNIDILKIDTEGHELEVLLGGSQLLRDSRIGLVVMECTLNPDNDHHTQYSDLHKLLCEFGYRPFGIYEQVVEWPTNSPVLRRIDATFISPRVIKRNCERT